MAGIVPRLGRARADRCPCGHNATIRQRATSSGIAARQRAKSSGIAARQRATSSGIAARQRAKSSGIAARQRATSSGIAAFRRRRTDLRQAALVPPNGMSPAGLYFPFECGRS
jgi:hypothetical protein